MTHSEKARFLFEESGFNCAQAVVGAFADEMGISEDTALRMASAFGGGFGRMREVCGAVCGMTLVFGALFGYSDAADKDAKAELYKTERDLLSEFSKENASFICREILGRDKVEVGGMPSERTAGFYHERPCLKCVLTAVDILDKYIESHRGGTI